MMFPEGVTTNGEGLIDFRRGAFDLGAPVKLNFIEYKISRFHPGISFISVIDTLILMLLQYRQRVTVKTLQGTYYPTQFTNWENFAKEAKILMCKSFKVKDFKGSFEKKNKYEKAYTPLDYKC